MDLTSSGLSEHLPPASSRTIAEENGRSRRFRFCVFLILYMESAVFSEAFVVDGCVGWLRLVLVLIEDLMSVLIEDLMSVLIDDLRSFGIALDKKSSNAGFQILVVLLLTSPFSSPITSTNQSINYNLYSVRLRFLLEGAQNKKKTVTNLPLYRFTRIVLALNFNNYSK